MNSRDITGMMIVRATVSFFNKKKLIKKKQNRTSIFSRTNLIFNLIFHLLLERLFLR